VEITWKKYEKKMKEGTVEEQRNATEQFLEERELQTKTSASAREWEKNRKAEFEKHKPEWRKLKEDKKNAQINKGMDNLLKAGTFISELTPAPGYILITFEKIETETSTGIILTNEVEDPNEGVVLVVGKELVSDRVTMQCPCAVGDRVLYKRGAGLQLMIKNKSCKLIYFPDILGIFNNA